jgi:beta-glucosidase
LDEPNQPLYSFGYGLSYTTFDYSDLKVESTVIGLHDTLVVSARVTNTGQVAGVEVVQAYVRDRVASVTRPVKELVGFERISLLPGESKAVRFEVPVSSLGFCGLDLTYVVEAGDFDVWIAPDSVGGLQGQFTVQGA